MLKRKWKCFVGGLFLAIAIRPAYPTLIKMFTDKEFYIFMFYWSLFVVGMVFILTCLAEEKQ